MSSLLSLYRTATVLGSPLIEHHLNKRLRYGKEELNRIKERLGQHSRMRPENPLVWVHAASVGESTSMLPLVEALLNNHPTFHILMTSGTVTSAQLLANQLPERAIHQYLPIDRALYVNTFLNHWHPDLVLWAESEFWPNLITLPSGRGIPMVLVNGRISPRSYKKWRLLPGLAKTILNGFSLCLAQTDSDAKRLYNLGAKRVENCGNLKFATPPLEFDTYHFNQMQNILGSRPRWLAASTHPGEEKQVWVAHKIIATTYPELLTIIVPRHVERGSSIAKELTLLGAKVAQRTKGDAISSTTNIYIADTMGELGVFFRVCPISFIGKSLVKLGGQNPIEPAKLESAIIFGPHMYNFSGISESLLNNGGAKEIAGAEELAGAVKNFLGNDHGRQKQIDKALDFANSKTGVLNTTLAALDPFVRKLYAGARML
ncbi:MAG: 3-deoxy-D-manno-octulosonic acid transferase [Magnetovibrio sp.]|nr:3-deoxy-D-manno-octulosonic acid transferase [Magnetovibrio sp.]